MDDRAAVSILGSTGSIGRNTLDVIRRFPDLYRVAGLAARGNVARLAAQVEEFRPDVVSTGSAEAARELGERLPGVKVECLVGDEGNRAVASLPQAQVVVSAIVGGAGLLPTVSAVLAGKKVALANKESLVMAGEILMREAGRRGAVVLPVDSEHSAIFQSLLGHNRDEVKRLILTASGGPLRTAGRAEMEAASREQVFRHPTWKMGAKVTVDSATMMNKGLEIIEARWLFGVAAENIEVLVHPQSIVHSMVEYKDGSVIAQLGVHDMKIPIAYALSFPRRLELGLERLDLARLRALEFFPLEAEKFPSPSLARRALAAGGGAPAVMNAANEVAVGAFLDGRIGFAKIAGVITAAMDRCSARPLESIEDAIEADAEGRRAAEEAVRKNAECGVRIAE